MVRRKERKDQDKYNVMAMWLRLAADVLTQIGACLFGLQRQVRSVAANPATY